jgi:hypothetical protein
VADSDDPLEGLEGRSLPVQVAVLANELRNQARRVSGVERGLRSVQVALWGLVLALITSAISISLSLHH